ncbi:hypothetical protein CcCBS67573_g09441 [Chytriomyces confervae]|uniref:Uncharacterized protein n=1 Tax=Chytriomyces confervae TaxID=246404 RepID=A0A507DVX5_9FUNG|nr:hypothetical protein CcCBS67573_g09441 [Chytriomyces confervae]
MCTVQVNEGYIARRASALAGSSPSLPKPVADEMSCLASFLESRTAKPATLLRSASPLDMVEFLIHKELNGRTQYHGITCNLPGTTKCAKSEPLLHLFTPPPAISAQAMPTSASQAPGTPALAEATQATPAWCPPIFTRLFEADIYVKISNPLLPAMIRLQWRQLWCFTLLVGISGHRTDHQQVVITLINGKTATTSKPDCFVVDHPAFLATLKLYARDCAWNGMNLSEGTPYIFFKVAKHKLPNKHAPASASNLNAAFQRILNGMGIFEGKTLYGFHVGNAVATALNTTDPAILRTAGGWHSDESALCYSQFAIVATAAEAGANNPTDAVRSWLAQRRDLAFFA